MKIIESLTRIYVEDIEAAIQFYEDLFGEKCNLRFRYPEYNLELARVHDFLILAGEKEDLKPFRNTSATLIVDDIEAVKAFVLKRGGNVIRDVTKVPTGSNLTMQHFDGTLIEYVQLSKVLAQ